MCDQAQAKIYRPLRAFLADDRGSMTMEFLLWLPIFVFVLAAVVDASILFQVQSDMQSVARDSARRMAMDEMNIEAAQDYALQSLARISPYEFTAAAQQYGSGSNAYSLITIKVPIAEVSIFDFFIDLLYEDCVAVAAMRNRVFPT